MKVNGVQVIRLGNGEEEILIVVCVECIGRDLVHLFT